MEAALSVIFSCVWGCRQRIICSSVWLCQCPASPLWSH